MSRRLAAAAVVAALLGLTAVGAAPGPRADAAPAPSSAVTVAGTGEFSNLKVTVAQTQELINQVVTVSWTGAKPTADIGVYLDYLQIMQCWGDDAGGPKREQCQFGALYTDTRGGAWTGTRQLSYTGSSTPAPGEPTSPKKLRDPLETTQWTEGQTAYVPFNPADGGTPNTKGGGGQYFDNTTTNEIPYARTRADGTGEEFFEMQTAAEAPGLGCGERLASGKGRSCWLVIVPRGETEVNGTTGDARPHKWLDSSPLSATNWAQRLVVPLSFQPLGLTCPIGKAERRTVGAEAITEAMLRWQPALCADNGPVFGYSQVTDDLARGRLDGSDPGLAFLARPAPPSTSAPRVYAPVAVSGLVIALNVEWQALPTAPDAVRQRDGQRVVDLRLTPKLVAKLLTQSYRSGADLTRTTVAGNPLTMRDDPEFIRLNPDFDQQLDLPLGDALVPLGQTDLATELWNYVLADPAARAFLAGQPDPKPNGDPDPNGMRVNPVYQTQTWPAESFPKSDLYCIPLRGEGGDVRDWCTLDMHPYAINMHDAARSASRGDTLVHNQTSRDNVGNVIGWKKGAPQAPGKRALLAVTDAATAERYGLPVAKLQNPQGSFVGPTTAGLLAGVAAMKPSDTPGVLQPDPQNTSAGAYPLTTITYAATVPAKLTRAAGREYADLLRYAAGPGQTPGVAPGTLPFGYAPMPAGLRAQTRAAADEIAAKAGQGIPRPGPPATPPAAASNTNPVKPAPTPPATVPNRGSVPSAAVPSALPPGLGSPVPVAQGRPTPASPVGNLRYVLVAIAVAGAAAALAGPIMLRLTRPRPGSRGGA